MRRLTLISLCACLAACSPKNDVSILEASATPTLQESVPAAPPATPDIRRISDIDFASYSRDLAKFVDLSVGEPMSEATPKIEAYFVPQSTDGEGLRPTETSYSTFEAEGAKVILVERINMRDDSVSAQQFYAIGKKQAEGTEMLIDYGMKIKCARGENKGKWGIELCP